jgi:hypothetical protein
MPASVRGEGPLNLTYEISCNKCLNSIHVSSKYFITAEVINFFLNKENTDTEIISIIKKSPQDKAVFICADRRKMRENPNFDKFFFIGCKNSSQINKLYVSP